MAAGVATTQVGSTDPRAQLRANQMAAQRARTTPLKAQSSFMSNIGGKYARAFMAGAALATATPKNFDILPQPEAHTYSMTEEDEDDDSSQQASMDAGEMTASNQRTQSEANEAYQRTFRQNQIKHQIGDSVGMLENRSYSDSEESSELDQIKQDFAERESNLLMNNQLGADQRSTAAKRAEQAAIRETGLEEGLKAMQDKMQKKLSGFVVNSSGAVGEVGDSFFEDGGVTQGAVFIKNQVQAVRTILSPPPPEDNEVTSLQDLQVKVAEAFLDSLVPRYNLHEPEDVEGFVTAIAQWLFIGAGIVVISFLVLTLITMVSTVFNFLNNPFTAMFNIVRTQMGI